MDALTPLAREINRAYNRNYKARSKKSQAAVQTRYWNKKAQLVQEALDQGKDPDVILNSLGISWQDIEPNKPKID